MPYERVVIEYEAREHVEMVPREVKEVVMTKVKRRGLRPVQKVIVDYY